MSARHMYPHGSNGTRNAGRQPAGGYHDPLPRHPADPARNVWAGSFCYLDYLRRNLGFA